MDASTLERDLSGRRLVEHLGYDLLGRLMRAASDAVRSALERVRCAGTPVGEELAVGVAGAAVTALREAADTWTLRHDPVEAAIPRWSWGRNGQVGVVTTGLPVESLEGRTLADLTGVFVQDRIEHAVHDAIVEALLAHAGQPLDTPCIDATAAAGGTAAGVAYGEWRCRFNPRTGYPMWYNERSGQWGDPD
ncbi:MAG: hypothetical protein ACYTG1_05935 [Planctomycetota bacterium]|jgi:hypothetical protein